MYIQDWKIRFYLFIKQRFAGISDKQDKDDQLLDEFVH